jgi:hypothetical protein
MVAGSEHVQNKKQQTQLVQNMCRTISSKTIGAQAV